MKLGDTSTLRLKNFKSKTWIQRPNAYSESTPSETWRQSHEEGDGVNQLEEMDNDEIGVFVTNPTNISSRLRESMFHVDYQMH